MMEISESASFGKEEEDWYINDLQLAAKLGKDLLERNSDLEVTLKQQEEIIEEYYNEIKFLSQQSKSLKEVSDSRILIYEQLEVTVLELERTNQKLLNESYEDKNRIKRLQEVVHSLELKCEDLQRMVNNQKEKETRLKKEINKTVDAFKKAELAGQIEKMVENLSVASYNTEDLELIKLKNKICKLSSQFCAEQRRFEALEAQTVLVLEESVSLKEQVQTLQAQKEKNDFFHQNQRICLVCRKTRSQDTLRDSEGFPAIFNSKNGVSLKNELERIKHQRFTPVNSNYAAKNPILKIEASNKHNSMGSLKGEDFYDSGYEDFSLTSTGSCNLSSIEFESPKAKSLFQELLEVDESMYTKRLIYGETFETVDINQEAQIEATDLAVKCGTKRFVNQGIQTEPYEVAVGFERYGLTHFDQYGAHHNPKKYSSCPAEVVKNLCQETQKKMSIEEAIQNTEIQCITCSYQEEKMRSSIELKVETTLTKSEKTDASASLSLVQSIYDVQVPRKSESPEKTSIFQILNDSMQHPNIFSAGPVFSPKEPLTRARHESEAPPSPQIRRKKYKSIFMRTPFFTIPSKTLFSGPLLKIGLPFAATQAEVLSNASKFWS